MNMLRTLAFKFHSHISGSVSQICVISRQRQLITLLHKQRLQFHHIMGHQSQ